MIILAINGIGGSGKDTFMNFCSKYAKCGIVSTIDIVKTMLVKEKLYTGTHTNLGWIDETKKGPRERKLLSDIKIALMDYDDIPFKCLLKSINKFKKNNAQIVLIAVREFDEMIKICTAYGAKSVLVKRPDIPICETEQMFLDQVPGDYKWDFIIENDSDLQNLKIKTRDFVKNLIENE
jgi:hypothetical protein